MNPTSSIVHEWCFLLAFGVCASACGGTDPILERADEIRAEEANASGGQGVSGNGSSQGSPVVGASGANQPGQPGQPGQLGQPGQPEPVTPGIPLEPESVGTPEPISTMAEGSAVMISGTVTVAGGQSGRIKIKGHLKDPRGQVHQPMGGDGIELDYPAETSFTLPVNLGATVWIEAFLDLDQNGGPSFKEPQATTPEAIVANGNVDSVELVLEVQAHRPEPTAPMGGPGQPIDAPPPPPPPDSP